MRKSKLLTLIGLGLATLSASAIAGEWKFLPVLDSSYKPDMAVFVTGGSLTPSNSGSSSGAYAGAELDFNCLMMQPPAGVIRSKISYGQFNQNGLKISTFEVNPHWTVEIQKDLTVGVGPGVGYVNTDINGQTTSLAALQIGGDLDYRVGMIDLGLGARWQYTADKEIAPGVTGANNFLIQAKVGVSF